MNEWQDKLKEAGFPDVVLMLDFETYYDSDYHLGKDSKALSIAEYVADSRFEMLGLGAGFVSDELQPWHLTREFVVGDKVKNYIRSLQDIYGNHLEDLTVVAKNCKFDMLILAEKYSVYPKFTIDVEDLSRTFDARMSQKLKDVAPMFGFRHKGDTSQFKGKRLNDIDIEALSEYCLNDIESQIDLFKHLLPIIVNPKVELAVAAHTLRLFTLPRIHFDFDLAAQIKADMKEQIERAVGNAVPWIMAYAGYSDEEILLAVQHGLGSELVGPWLSGSISFLEMMMFVLGPKERVPTKPGKPPKRMKQLLGPGKIPAFSKDDDGCKALLEHKDDTVRMLMTARVAMKSWPTHLGRVEKMEAQARASRGLLRVPLKYYGCHTGRWSGEERINLGNLGGSGRGKEISKLIGKVRHTMRAAPGCVFLLVDSSQIEARNVAWYAGQDDLLEEFRNDGDPYSTLASELFKCKVWKWGKGDIEEYPGQEKKVTIYRGFGKDAILGCGYGMGPAKFHKRCLSNDTLRPHFDSGEYTEATTKNIVDTYRNKYCMIPKFWGKIERGWRLATKYKKLQEVGPLKFWHAGGTTFMRLPSDRVIRYRNARVTHDDELMWKWGTLWGGSLTENAVQSTCRDPLRDWILKIESELGLPVVHHVYDEVVVMVGEDRAEQALKDVIEIMETCPSWATGMPFKAEGKINPYYTK